MSKLLFIDDDLNILDTLKELFQYDYPGSFYALTPEEAERAFHEERENINMIILDYKMPKESGVDILKKIRKIDRNIPIIFFSGFSDPELLKTIIKLGANDFVSKPDFEELRLSIKENLKEASVCKISEFSSMLNKK